MKRICRKCKIERNIDQFRKAPSSKGGRRWVCFPCERVRSIEYNKVHPEISRLSKENFIKNNPLYFKEYKKIPNSKYAIYKANAKRRGLLFPLSKEQFISIISQSCFYCASDEFVEMGIDRSDSDIGYLIANCVPCCGCCNIMKMSLSVKDFLDQIFKIYNKHFNVG